MLIYYLSTRKKRVLLAQEQLKQWEAAITLSMKNRYALNFRFPPIDMLGLQQSLPSPENKCTPFHCFSGLVHGSPLNYMSQIVIVYVPQKLILLEKYLEIYFKSTSQGDWVRWWLNHLCPTKFFNFPTWPEFSSIYRQDIYGLGSMETLNSSLQIFVLNETEVGIEVSRGVRKSRRREQLCSTNWNAFTLHFEQGNGCSPVTQSSSVFGQSSVLY